MDVFRGLCKHRSVVQVQCGTELHGLNPNLHPCQVFTYNTGSTCSRWLLKILSAQQEC